MSERTAKIKRPKPVTELVLDRLRADIVENRLGLGEKISETLLADRYGVTKAPVRAAYIRLETEGLLNIRPQSGTFVFLPTVEELRALCEVRNALEIEALTLAMTRNAHTLASETARICDEMTEALDRGARDVYHTLDTRLHMVFVEQAASPLLQRIYDRQISGPFAALRTRFSQRPAHNEQSLSEHYAICDAIRAGDIAIAQANLRKHIAATERYYVAFVE